MLQVMNDSGDGASLATLVERSAELKRTLVDFVCSPRFERHLAPFMRDAADPEGGLSEGEAIDIIDRFALQYRLPNGKTVLEQFLASRPGHRQEAALAAHPGRRRPPNVPGVDIPAFELPAELADADTIGIIYDETDGLNFYNEYGMLRDLFADPALAAGKRYSQVLRREPRPGISVIGARLSELVGRR